MASRKWGSSVMQRSREPSKPKEPIKEVGPQLAWVNARWETNETMVERHDVSIAYTIDCSIHTTLPAATKRTWHPPGGRVCVAKSDKTSVL